MLLLRDLELQISKYKNIFAKGYTWNHKTVPWAYFICDLIDDKIVGNYEKELWKRIAKVNQTEFRVEKVIKKKGDKLYVKWRGYNNRFNSWIYKMSYFPEP